MCLCTYNKAVMKRKSLFIPLSIGLIALTSCYYAPSRVEYNGVAYKNNWYKYCEKDGRSLHVCGILPPEKDPLFNVCKIQSNSIRYKKVVLYGRLFKLLLFK